MENKIIRSEPKGTIHTQESETTIEGAFIRPSLK